MTLKNARVFREAETGTWVASLEHVGGWLDETAFDTWAAAFDHAEWLSATYRPRAALTT